jgi:hypothetical protein
MRNEKRIQLSTQRGVSGALAIEKVAPRRLRELEHRRQQFLQPAPPGGGELVP